MRLAWCRPTTTLSDRLDDTAALIAELEARHEITPIDRSSMHDLVRLDFRRPFDLHIFELDDTDDHAFIWPYVMHYPGVLRLRSASLHHSRASSLARQRRGPDRRAELAFGHGDLTAAPIVGSRLVVVHDEYLAAALKRDFPMAQVRHIPIGWKQSIAKGPAAPPPGSHRSLRVAMLAHPPRRTLVRALERARESGVPIELMAEASPDTVLRDADIILVLPWPRSDDPTSTIAAMSSGRPVVIFERESTAGWPTLDPQTWQPRGFDPRQAPIAIAIDPRDEAHSLALALRRLAVDRSLVDDLGRAAQAWWQRHATIGHAAAAWEAVIEEAASLPPPPRPPGWPRHLTADGSDRARDILGEFAISVDFLG